VSIAGDLIYSNLHATVAFMGKINVDALPQLRHPRHQAQQAHVIELALTVQALQIVSLASSFRY
jgi:hypothetical protein